MRKTFVSKKCWEALEKKVADLEKQVQAQPAKEGLSLAEQAFLVAVLNIKSSYFDTLCRESLWHRKGGDGSGKEKREKGRFWQEAANFR